MRQCLFCSNDAATGEDVWPLWLLKRFQTPEGVRVDFTRGDRVLPAWTKARHGHRVRYVCARCNNGWMSSLEIRVKPVIERLLSDNEATVHPQEQAALAMWAMKGAMVFEALREGTASFYSQAERCALRQTQTLPAATEVWLAKCIALPGIYVSGSDHADTADHSPAGNRLYVTTMGFGHVALQVATIKLAVPVAGRIVVDVLGTEWPEVTLRLSNSGSVLRWPTRLGLVGEAGLEAFAHRWFT